MSLKEYLKNNEINESPVGMVGRTGKVDAQNHISPELLKRFSQVVKELGGKTVARMLIDGDYTNGEIDVPEVVEI